MNTDDVSLDALLDKVEAIAAEVPAFGLYRGEAAAFVLRMNHVTRFGMLRQALAEVSTRDRALNSRETRDPEATKRLERERKMFAEFAVRLHTALSQKYDLADPEIQDSLAGKAKVASIVRRGLVELASSGTLSVGTVESMAALKNRHRLFAFRMFDALRGRLAMDGVLALARLSEDGVDDLLTCDLPSLAAAAYSSRTGIAGSSTPERPSMNQLMPPLYAPRTDRPSYRGFPGALPVDQPCALGALGAADLFSDDSAQSSGSSSSMDSGGGDSGGGDIY